MIYYSELATPPFTSGDLAHLTYFDFQARLPACVAARGQNLRKMFGDIPLRLGSRSATLFERAMQVS